MGARVGGREIHSGFRAVNHTRHDVLIFLRRKRLLMIKIHIFFPFLINFSFKKVFLFGKKKNLVSKSTQQRVFKYSPAFFLLLFNFLSFVATKNSPEYNRSKGFVKIMLIVL